MSPQQEIQDYGSRGFSEVNTDSGTGSRVLINASSRRVIKINQDPAYAKFADFCQRNPELAVPRISSHVYPLGPFVPLSNDRYSVAEMELLEPLTEDEQSAVLVWIRTVFDTLKSGNKVADHFNDPFTLKHTFAELLTEAQRVGASLDVLKGTNYMKRVCEAHECIVFSDPFN